MEQYHALIGVVIEKLGQSYKELQFNYNGLDSILQQHTPEEAAQTPELITIAELRDVYKELIERVEQRLPGIKEL